MERQEFVIEGGHELSGDFVVQGNKNEALPVLCGAILNKGPIVIKNLPDIQDIRTLIEILRFIGITIENKKEELGELTLSSNKKLETNLPSHLISHLRGSVTLLGPLLGRAGAVFLPRPGGDKIGRRRIDTHLLALEALGAKIEVFQSGYRLTCKELVGTEILLDEASVTGTENAIFVAAVAKGVTIIENAASEPHVQGVCRFLSSQGVKIEGIGSNRLTIHGVESWENLQPCKHRIGPDYLEIGSFVAASALTGGKLRIFDIEPRDLRLIKLTFSRLGIEWHYDIKEKSTDLILPAGQVLEIKTDVHGEIPKIDDAPWPMFPADLISIALVIATQCKGEILIHEKLFESRLFFIDKLIGMGAKIVLCDPHRAVVMGKSQLYGSKMSSPDIRAGMALVIAALVAKGESTIQNVIQIDRGYQNIDQRLRSLGAKFTRV